MTHPYRYALTVEYDGGLFSGWQRQDTAPSVQHVLEQAIQSLTQQSVCVYGAGRTDAGVHAVGQVAHIDLPTLWPAYKVRQGLNFYLQDKGVVVVHVVGVGQDFHARFSAVERRYRYTLVNRPSPSLFLQTKAWWVPTPLDVDAMACTARLFCGTHDFSSFRHRDCQSRSPIKTVNSVSVVQDKHVIHIDVAALSFLHRQVRMMMGALIQVGKGKWTDDQVKALLDHPGKGVKCLAVPARGLCLMAVRYDAPYDGVGA